MNIQYFEVTNAARGTREKPTINFSCRGEVTFNSKSEQVMNLKDGDFLHFAQDKDRKTDWYIVKNESGKGFKLGQRKQKTNRQLLFHSKPLFRSICESLNIKSAVSLNMKIAIESVHIGEGIVGFPIITSSAKVK